MKDTICDVDLLKNLQPSVIEGYLQATGWYERNRISDRVSIWTRDTFSENKLKIQVPLDMEFDDYPLAIYEIMNTLEKAENRSQLDIIRELITNLPNITIQGVVMQITTPNVDKLSGEIALLGVVVDKLQNIRIELSDRNYILAIKAYQERLPVVCVGDLIKEDNTFVLKNIRYFNFGKDIDDLEAKKEQFFKSLDRHNLTMPDNYKFDREELHERHHPPGVQIPG